jgi:hypothetical protein
MSLARMRRSGWFGLIAGIVFLIGRPLYQALFLTPTGFAGLDPALPSSFANFLLWASAHTGRDLGSRVVALIPFVLAISLPGPLRRVLWPGQPQQGRSAMLLGQAGFVIFALVLLLGFFIVPNAAHDYATHPADRALIARSYAGLYTFEVVVAYGVAAGLIAVSIGLMSQRGIQTNRLPRWYAYISLATAGLLGLMAILTILGSYQGATQAQEFALPALAIWLILTGVLLLRVQERPHEPAETVAEPAPPPSAPAK